jgi:hypothetical protein
MWQAIDTAPKDGTPFLGACFEEEGMTFCGAAFWETPEDYRIHMGYPADFPPENDGEWVSYEEFHGLRANREGRALTHWAPPPGRAEWRPIDATPRDGMALIGAVFEEVGMTFCGAAFWETPEDRRKHLEYPDDPPPVGDGAEATDQGEWVSYYEQYGTRIDRQGRPLTHWVPLPGEDSDHEQP